VPGNAQATWPSLRRDLSSISRATRVVTSTKAMSTKAAAQACALRFRSGDSEYSKMITGTEATEIYGSVVTTCPKIEHVNSRGAVSPAARATARVVPVTMPPIAVGRTTPSTVRHFETPSA